MVVFRLEDLLDVDEPLQSLSPGSMAFFLRGVLV
jgi:hypothetical protein